MRISCKVATTAHGVPRSTSIALASMVVLITSLLVGPAQLAHASDGDALTSVPQMVVRAGSTGTLYVLWSATCHGKTCYELGRTTNAGRTFTIVKTPPITTGLATTSSYTGSLDRLVFANAQDGVATEDFWSPNNKVYVTFDGGRSWNREATKKGEVVMALNSSPSAWFEITAQCDSTHDHCTHWELRRAPLASTRWTSTRLPSTVVRGSLTPGVTVTAWGSKVWIRVSPNSGPPRLATSSNYGETFVVKTEPILGAALACIPEATSSVTLWAACAEGNMLSELLFSSDGGAKWRLASQQLSNHLSFGIFDPISTKVAYATDGFDNTRTRRIYRLTSSSESARLIGTAPNGDLYSLTFVNAKQGLAWGPPPSGEESFRLWRTGDAGREWSVIPGP